MSEEPTTQPLNFSKDFPKAYLASEHEEELYALWEKSGVFSPHSDTSQPAFSIVMPPPNANGDLHIGHALEHTLLDILTRYHRMKGERVLLVPGSDHAGIETQVVLEKKLEKEGRSRFQMTKEQFYQEAYQFSMENKSKMENQIRQLGVSCDWKTNRFTLDPLVVERVYKTFRQMYEEGLIYRGERIINYCVKYQTAYSDLEVVHEERTDPLYYLKYGPLTVATVRPETQFGDVAIAVHPQDERYKQYLGQEVEVTLATGEKRKLPVMANPLVNPGFGTGAVKVTPAHDLNDFEMAQGHDLPIISVINTDGRLMETAGKFAGLKVAEAREKVVATLQEMGLVEKIDSSYRHQVALCYKSRTQIEPLVMPQWYIRVEKLKEAAIQAIEQGEVSYLPAGYQKIQLDWLRGLKDWNISRQIWWGIPINQAMPDNPEIASDPDTFDTWFSSSQWPYLVLGVLEGRDYLKEFYPTTVMGTGRDLIFRWVTTMLLLGLYIQKAVPFRQVYFHGMILDPYGKKMSKSKGNVVSPMDLIAKYGCDGLRFGLTVGTSAGSDIPLPEEKMVGGRNFANKLWNIARFVLSQLEDHPPSQLPQLEAKTEADKMILEELATAVKEATTHLEKFRFAQYAAGLHEFVWHRLADIYLEEAKSQQNEKGEISEATGVVLYHVLTTSLKLLHPLMPFVTEAIFQRLPKREGMLISASWP